MCHFLKLIKRQHRRTSMDNNYKIEVSIKIVECQEKTQPEPQQQQEGHFEFVISGEQGCNIDQCERALLQANSPALRDALSTHLTAISKKKAIEMGQECDCYVNERPIQVDGEVGRFTFNTHCIQLQEKLIFDTSKKVFPVLKGKEWYKTQGFFDIAIVHGTLEQSYRDTMKLINRIRYQPDATPLRTLCDSTEVEGKQILSHIEQEALKILTKNDFCPLEGTPPPEQIDDFLEQKTIMMPTDSVEEAVAFCIRQEPELKSAIENNPVPYEEPDKTANISIDDVGVKEQKEHRDKPSSQPEKSSRKKDKKYIHNTVVHIEHGQGSYLLNGHGVGNVLKLVLALERDNDLLKNNLIFFVDGQKTLFDPIVKAFLWVSKIQIILDWYHLKKKCELQFSLGLLGYKSTSSIRSQIKQERRYGAVDCAHDFLRKIDVKFVKNQEAIDKLINYLQRNKPYIPCYKT